MRPTSLCLLLVLALVSARCGGDEPAPTTADEEGYEPLRVLDEIPDELTGLWEETRRGSGGQTLFLRLGADGTLIRAMAVMIDFKYEYDGKRVRAVDETMHAGETFDVETEIDGDEMVQHMPGEERGTPGSEIRKRRIEGLPDGEGGILGIWEHQTPSGLAYERYGPDGRMQMRIPMLGEGGSSEGSFELQEGHLVLMVQDVPAEHFDYEVEGDRLTLRMDGEVAHELVRAEHGDWYVRAPAGSDHR